MKYNKQGTNLQGNINIIVRRGYMVYQFKSNALNSLTVVTTPAPASATFTGKANLQSWDVRDPTVINSLGGNLTLQLQMHDVAEPGAGKDTLGITVWDSGGALLFSSNWQFGSSPRTVEQALGASPGGGNITVH